jgi:hypothetical protein
MKLVEINWNPTNRQLRQFGLICLVALPLLGWLWGGANPWVLGALAGIGFILSVAGLFCAPALKPIFLGLTILVLPIGLVVGELSMLLIFFGVFLPMGFVFRLLNRDRLQLDFDTAARTYWEDKPQPKSVASYYRQW